jgi:large subunit ribosomal protein L35
VGTSGGKLQKNIKLTLNPAFNNSVSQWYKIFILEGNNMVKQKIKSHSGAKKRFKFTASGKIKYKKAGRRHLLIGTSTSRRYRLKKSAFVDKANIKDVKAKLPCGR